MKTPRRNNNIIPIAANLATYLGKFEKKGKSSLSHATKKMIVGTISRIISKIIERM